MGYVDEIYDEEKFNKKDTQQEFTLLKFILNNNDGVKIQCNIFNDNIKKFAKLIKPNSVILCFYKTY